MDIEGAIPHISVASAVEAERLPAAIGNHWKIALAHVDEEGKATGQIVLLSDEIMDKATIGPEGLLQSAITAAYRQVLEHL